MHFHYDRGFLMSRLPAISPCNPCLEIVAVRRSVMKKLITAFVLATVVMAPALASAATRHQDVQSSQAQTTVIPWDAVVVNGKIVGQDPDPNVRLQMSQEAYSTGY
jgi:hypothetical protein